MSVVTESQQRAIDYAKNYQMIPNDASLIGPVTVGNVGVFNERKIINLCIKTRKSEPRNAAISFPMSWKKATMFKPGDLVNIKVQDGYVANLWHARPEIISSQIISQSVTHPDIKEESPSTVTSNEPDQQRPY